MAPTRLLTILGCSLLPLVLVALMMGPVLISPVSLVHALLDLLGVTGSGGHLSQVVNSRVCLWSR